MSAEDTLRLARLRRDVKLGRARAIRQTSGLSQSEVARTLGASRGAVSLWETGRRAPRGALALRYAALLESLDQISRADAS